MVQTGRWPTLKLANAIRLLFDSHNLTWWTRAAFKRGGRRLLCKPCGRRLAVDDGFLHMWYRKHTVTEAVDLYHEGLSTRKVVARTPAERAGIN